MTYIITIAALVATARPVIRQARIERHHSARRRHAAITTIRDAR
jgi:hypothetical protein